MPPIRAFHLADWRRQARDWRRRHRGQDPTALSREARVADPLAKAAYLVAVVGDRVLPVGAGGCTNCGEPTASWCEGCYKRCRGSEPFSSVCQECDALRLVCDRCNAQEITYEEGHREFLASRPSTSEDTISVTGLHQENGDFIEVDGEFVSLTGLAQRLGVTEEELVDTLRRGVGAQH